MRGRTNFGKRLLGKPILERGVEETLILEKGRGGKILRIYEYDEII